MTARIRVLAVLAAAVALAAPASARADGDPASDVLLSQDVFFPYAPPTSAGMAHALLDETAQARKDGWPIKVALIANGNDLGAVANLNGNPQGYANFLASELGGGKLRMLIVMPVGFGGQNLGKGVDTALNGLGPIDGGGDPLAKLALTAVARLAAADGHKLAVPKIDTSAAGKRPYRENASVHGAPSGGRLAKRVKAPPGANSGNGGIPPFVIYGLPIVLILGALGFLTLRDRRRAESTDL